jgi:hypothetical protein
VRNPLAESAAADPEDRELVCQAQGGNREALEQLITRHQAWIYNIVLRMVYLPQDAEDATQEILVKLMTKLSTFVGKSSFRTWLYRIVVNHVLNMKRGRADTAGWTFTRYGDGLEISRENFRQKRARARRDLHNFLHDKCGLVNEANPCRCAKKTQGFMKAGFVDPQNLLFAREHVTRVRDVAEKKCEDLDALDEAYAELHRDHPFQEPADFVTSLRTLINGTDFRSTLEPE